MKDPRSLFTKVLSLKPCFLDDTPPLDVNPSQWQAIIHKGSHLLIVAGPGTGKTHTLTYRIAYCIKYLKSEKRILAITFTNKAAEEMYQRLQNHVDSIDRYAKVGTFHYLCLQLLRKYSEHTDLPENFRIATDQEIDMAIKRIASEKKSKKRRQIQEQISFYKSLNFRQTPPDMVERYNGILRQYGLLDFDDLLLYTYRLFSAKEDILHEVRETYPFIFVDEYQDINDIQNALLKMLVGDGNVMTAIGDPHQAIYGFRGADVRYFESFTGDFPGAKVLSLADNYRSAQNILSASGQVISKIKSHHVPALTAKMYQEGRLSIHQAATDKAEAEYVVHHIEKMVGGMSMFSQDSGRVQGDEEGVHTFGDIAVLYRLNSQRLALIEAFDHLGIPFQIAGDRSLLEQPGMAEIITLLNLAWNISCTPTMVRRLLETTIAGWHALQGKRIVEIWEAQRRNIRLEDLACLVDQERLFDDSTILLQLTQYIKEINALRHIFQTEDYRSAISSLKEFSVGGTLLSSHKSTQEHWQKLIQLSLAFDHPDELLDYLTLQRSEDNLSRSEKVSFMTMHAAKGLEFPVVFLVGCEQNIIPLNLEGLSSNKEEERRLFYVAMTRAKQRLYMIAAKKRFLYGKVYNHPLSEFLTDIEEELKTYEPSSYKPGRRKKDDQQLSLF